VYCYGLEDRCGELSGAELGCEFLLACERRGEIGGEGLFVDDRSGKKRRNRISLCSISRSRERESRISAWSPKLGSSGRLVGLNSAGLGVTLNAIRCPGVSYTKLPIHLSLRLILESPSVSSALSKLSETGCAASAHMLIADPTTSVGLEATHKTLLQLKPDSYGRVLHTNHLLLEHEGVVDTVWLKDSITRLARIGELTDGMIGKDEEVVVGVEEMRSVFSDECGAPAAINRKEVEGVCESSTIFNIWMDLGKRVAEVRVGRPTEGGEVLVLRPEVVPN